MGSLLQMFAGLRSRALHREKVSLHKRYLTPLPEAVEELKRRRQDPKLVRKVERYLKGDIPEHFKNGPILYLARHVATPNFETLRFLHLVEPVEIPAVIGQDVKDRFVAQNQLKKALGKMPISQGAVQREGKYHERHENFSIIDFNASNGRPFTDIKTTWGESIVEFHNGLFKHLCKAPVRIVDDSEWIDRNHRGNLVEHYKRFLALFIVHGILFEDYSIEDKEEILFLENVLRPAFSFVERKFGCRPLIAELTPTAAETAHFWISYPKNVVGAIERAGYNSARSKARDVE